MTKYLGWLHKAVIRKEILDFTKNKLGLYNAYFTVQFLISKPQTTHVRLSQFCIDWDTGKLNKFEIWFKTTRASKSQKVTRLKRWKVKSLNGWNMKWWYAFRKYISLLIRTMPFYSYNVNFEYLSRYDYDEHIGNVLLLPNIIVQWVLECCP